MYLKWRLSVVKYWNYQQYFQLLNNLPLLILFSHESTWNNKWTVTMLTPWASKELAWYWCKQSCDATFCKVSRRGACWHRQFIAASSDMRLFEWKIKVSILNHCSIVLPNTYLYCKCRYGNMTVMSVYLMGINIAQACLTVIININTCLNVGRKKLRYLGRKGKIYEIGQIDPIVQK